MNLKNNWGIWTGIVIVVAFVVIVAMSGAKVRPGGVSIQVDPVSSVDHIRGNPQAKAVLIEYGDYQCPACGVYEPLVDQIAADFPDDLAIVFRHFPLRTLHQNATIAAQAAEAADMQGKFWQMHAMLYTKQIDWEKAADPKAIFAGYADELGLDKTKFIFDIDSEAAKEKVEASRQRSEAIGLTGTPTFFLNGKQLLENPRGYEAFKALIQAEISK